MKHTKPFNVEHAQAGAPYACRDGGLAAVLKWDGRGDQPLIGVRGDNDIPTCWNLDGGYIPGCVIDRFDLVMLPLGEIDGKPVFTCDLVERLRDGAWYEVHAGASWRDFTGCRWPAPAKVYPTTNMKAESLRGAYNSDMGGPVLAALERVANAALRHAVDSGQVVTREEFDHAIMDRKTRDKAVAEEVIKTLRARDYDGIGIDAIIAGMQA